MLQHQPSPPSNFKEHRHDSRMKKLELGTWQRIARGLAHAFIDSANKIKHNRCILHQTANCTQPDCLTLYPDKLLQARAPSAETLLAWAQEGSKILS